MGDIKVKEAKNIERLRINEDHNKLRITELSNIDPLVVDEVRHIAPAAVHIKELNHIDPITIESLKVNEIRNLDPIRVEKFNVTNLPTVNLSLRQLPAVDMNIRRLPPLSVGLHQDFCLPSSYTLRARLLGIEFLRLNLDGHTVLSPRDKVRREQARNPSQSFPQVAVAGNPAIPSRIIQKGSTVVTTPSPCHQHMPPSHLLAPQIPLMPQMSQRSALRPTAIPSKIKYVSSGTLKVGHVPSHTFSMTKGQLPMNSMGSSVSSGEN